MDPAVARGDADVEADEAGAPVGVAAAVAEGVGAVAVAVAAAAEEGAGVVVAVAVVTAVSWEAGRRAAAATAGAVGGVGEGCKGCGGGGVSRGSIVGPVGEARGRRTKAEAGRQLDGPTWLIHFVRPPAKQRCLSCTRATRVLSRRRKEKSGMGAARGAGGVENIPAPPAVYLSSKPGCWVHRRGPPGRETKRRFSGSRDPAATAARRETAELRPEGGPTDPTSLVQRKTTDYYAVSR